MSVKQDSLFCPDNQRQHQDQKNHEHVQRKTHSQIDDTALLNAIQSADQGRALRFLKNDHHFSQDALDKALISASHYGNKYLIQRLVRLGANVHCKDTNGNTPLLICAKNGFTDIVKFLLSKQADVSAFNSAGDTALILSIRSSGSTEMVKVLLEQPGININHQNQNGCTALIKAVEVMDTDAIVVLLKKLYNHKLKPPSHRNHHVTPKLHDQSVNCRGRLAQEIADRSGLGKILNIIKEHINTGVSPLVLAMEADDMESFNILIDCQFSESDSVQRYIEEAFTKIFEKYHVNDYNIIKDSELAMVKRLLEYGADVNMHLFNSSKKPVSYDMVSLHLIQSSRSFFKREYSPLHTASKLGHIGLLELLLSYKAEVNQDCFAGSALDCALRHGHIECARLLIQHGANLNVKLALILAVDHQKTDYMTFIFENYQQEALNYLLQNTDNSLLISAVNGGNLEIIGQILDAGVDINQPNKTGVTPLVESKNVEVAQLLIKKGADVNQLIKCKEHGSITPVIHIMMARNSYDSSLTQLVQVLLENGACINGRNIYGETAIILAALREGNVAMLQILLDHGADLSDNDKDGNTALIKAVAAGCCQNVSFLLKFATNKIFLNAQNCKGLTALMCAVTSENHSVLTELINCGADVNIRDRKGNTVLLQALIENSGSSTDILTTLISAGCDLNCQNNYGFSPLMLAARMFMTDAVQILLNSGADINAVSKNDHTLTALSYLLNSSYFRQETKCCMQYLLERGASSSYVSPIALQKMIIYGWIDLIPKMIQSGLGPADVEPDEMLWSIVEIGFNCSVSPIYLALVIGNVELAHYFIEILFLTKSDVVMLMNNKTFRYVLERKKHMECLHFLDELSSQPLSLFTLAFVTVSSALGTSHGRENRVNLLPLPQVMKDKLLFKSETVTLTNPALDTYEMVALFLRGNSGRRRMSDDDFYLASYQDSDNDSYYDYGQDSPDYDYYDTD